MSGGMEASEAMLGPSVVFQAFVGYQKTEALRTAVDIDLFTAIGAGAATAKEIAARCDASERGVRILCDYLVVHGLLTKDDRYRLTPAAAMFLDRSSPGCIAPAIHFLASPFVMRGFAQLTTAVRTGRAAVGDEPLSPDHPMWVEFARSMAPLAGLMAELLANLLEASAAPPWKVLDVGAGHGLFGITLARHNPKAEIVALDWKNVLAVAEENARTAGVADRFRTLPGSAGVARSEREALGPTPQRAVISYRGAGGGGTQHPARRAPHLTRASSRPMRDFLRSPRDVRSRLAAGRPRRALR